MLKVINGELYNVSLVDKSEVSNRVKNVMFKVENIDNQLRTLLDEKKTALSALEDIKEIVPQLFPDMAQKLGLSE